MSNQVLRAEHDEVLSSLSARESTRHFAHAAIGFFVTLLFAGTAGKLWWDFHDRIPLVWQVAAGAACLGLLYALIRVAVGARLHRRERALLARLRELRNRLGFDGP